MAWSHLLGNIQGSRNLVAWGYTTTERLGHVSPGSSSSDSVEEMLAARLD